MACYCREGTSVENGGGLINTGNQKIYYTAFNKVSRIGERSGTDSLELLFTYGPEQQRWKTVLKKNGSDLKTTIFAGDHETITENGQTRQLYYIGASGGLAAVYVKQTGQTDKIYYLHTDHLGSVVKLTDGGGAEVFKASYDAWGNRAVSNNTFAFHRGFTGHEHLAEFNLIDMNGRMYDPLLGRFLSPDPFVQMANYSQNFNRYSYCLNNPLIYTDQTGEWFGIDDLLVAGAGFVFGYLGHGISTGNWGWKAVAAGGINMTGVYTNGDFSIGAGDNYWGWNASATYRGWGGGYGQTSYSATEVMGQQLGSQRVGTYTGYFNHNSFSISNDLWGDKGDRWRTSAAELTIGNWSVGTYLYTNDGEKESRGGMDESENCIPPWPVGKNKNEGLSTWTNGRPYFAPFWVGYRNGNQITRIGFSHEIVHNMTQNWVHKGFGKQNYYMSYDEFKRGGYFYTGYRNPLSLWDR